MTAYAPARAVKRPTRRTQTATRPLELFDEATLLGLKPSPMLARLGLLDPRHWFTATAGDGARVAHEGPGFHPLEAEH